MWDCMWQSEMDLRRNCWPEKMYKFLSNNKFPTLAVFPILIISHISIELCFFTERQVSQPLYQPEIYQGWGSLGGLWFCLFPRYLDDSLSQRITKGVVDRLTSLCTEQGPPIDQGLSLKFIQLLRNLQKIYGSMGYNAR